MKKYLIVVVLSLVALSSFSQPRILSGRYPNGEAGKYFYDTLRNQYWSSPLYAVNDSTAGMDTSRYYVSTFASNTTSDSVVLTFLNGRRLAAKAASTGGGGGGSAAGPSNSVQVNVSNAFTGYSTFTFNPTVTASSGVGNNLTVGKGSLIASANGDVLTGVYIDNPTFTITPNATTFTNVRQYAATINGSVAFRGAYTPAADRGQTVQSGLYVSRSLNGSNLEGSAFYDTLNATANNATLTGVRITPSFVTNGFTNVTSNALVVSGGNTSLQAMTATTGQFSGALQMGTSYPRIRAFDFGLPSIEYSSTNGTTVQGQAGANDDGITGIIKNDFFTALRYSGSTYYIGTASARRFGFSSGGGMTWFTAAAEPATPASGSVVEWWDGTNKKWKKSDGSTGTIY